MAVPDNPQPDQLHDKDLPYLEKYQALRMEMKGALQEAVPFDSKVTVIPVISYEMEGEAEGTLRNSRRDLTPSEPINVFLSRQFDDKQCSFGVWVDDVCTLLYVRNWWWGKSEKSNIYSSTCIAEIAHYLHKGGHQ